MIVRKTLEEKRKPTTFEMGQLNLGYLNLLNQLNHTHLNPELVIRGIQHIAEGNVILEDIFIHTYVRPSFTGDNGGSDLNCLRTIPGLVFGSTYQKEILNLPSFPRRPGGILSREIGRSRGVPPVILWNLLMTGTESDKPICSSDRIRFIKSKSLSFTPLQLKDMIIRGSSCATGSEWTYRRHNLLLCQSATTLYFARVQFAGTAIIVSIEDLDTHLDCGDRLITKQPD